MTSRHHADRHRCDRCRGRGWIDGAAVEPLFAAAVAVARPDEWPVLCPSCEGRGSFSTTHVASKIGEDKDTLLRLARGFRVRARTAARLCGKLLGLSEALGER